ncbi:MAG: hypothetical protein HFG29_10805 [Eubacterium sp.]|nr:hypothetical protein [Eubacterium sp.]
MGEPDRYLAWYHQSEAFEKGRYKSVAEMAQSIINFIKQYNLIVKAFNWKYAG